MNRKKQQFIRTAVVLVVLASMVITGVAAVVVML